MAYIMEDKSKWIEESYTPDWVEEIKTNPFEFKKIPWVNEPQINSWISIET